MSWMCPKCNTENSDYVIEGIEKNKCLCGYDKSLGKIVMEPIRLKGIEKVAKDKPEWTIILDSVKAEFIGRDDQKITIEKADFLKYAKTSSVWSSYNVVVKKEAGTELKLFLSNDALSAIAAWVQTDTSPAAKENYQTKLKNIKGSQGYSQAGFACIIGAATVFYNFRDAEVAALLLLIGGIITLVYKKRWVLILLSIICLLDGGILYQENKGALLSWFLFLMTPLLIWGYIFNKRKQIE